jgi:hypothetical protein
LKSQRADAAGGHGDGLDLHVEAGEESAHGGGAGGHAGEAVLARGVGERLGAGADDEHAGAFEIVAGAGVLDAPLDGAGGGGEGGGGEGGEGGEQGGVAQQSQGLMQGVHGGEFGGGRGQFWPHGRSGAIVNCLRLIPASPAGVWDCRGRGSRPQSSLA